MSCLSAPEFSAWWSGYTSAQKLVVMHAFARNTRTVEEVDAFAILHTQTRSFKDRFVRNAGQTHAGLDENLQAVKVAVPKSLDRKMLGLKTAAPVKKGTKLSAGRGFWWPESFPLPADGQFGKNPMKPPRPLYGVRLAHSPVLTRGLVYVMNASSGMCLFNHYGGFMNTPNAELVVHTYEQGGKEKMT